MHLEVFRLPSSRIFRYFHIFPSYFAQFLVYLPAIIAGWQCFPHGSCQMSRSVPLHLPLDKWEKGFYTSNQRCKFFFAKFFQPLQQHQKNVSVCPIRKMAPRKIPTNFGFRQQFLSPWRWRFRQSRQILPNPAKIPIHPDKTRQHCKIVQNEMMEEKTEDVTRMGMFFCCMLVCTHSFFRVTSFGVLKTCFFFYL